MKQPFYSNLKQISKLNSILEPLENVLVQGWVEKEHRKGKWSFIHIKDGTSNDSIQAVIPKDVARNIGIGSAIEVEGEWKKSIGKQQAMELYASKCKIWAKDEGQPLPDDADILRRNFHLRSKHSGFADILRLRSQLNLLTHRYFNQRGYVHIDTPLLSSNDCEGAGEAFKAIAPNDTDFFGDDDKFLPVSGQLHLEAMTSGLPQVYTLNSAFRAEKSLSRQHIAEFRMLEAERAFSSSIFDLCDEVESYIKYVATEIQPEFEKCVKLSVFQESRDTSSFKPFVLSANKDTEFPRIHYKEAVDILRKRGEVVDNGFNKAQELLLVEICKSPLFVYNFPSNQKPFYMKRTEDGQEAECFDLLSGYVGELAGGSLRETDLHKILERQNIPSLAWYYELRKRGTPQTGGFGLGIDRFMQMCFGIANIKDTIPFPRWFKHYGQTEKKLCTFEDLNDERNEIPPKAYITAILDQVKILYGALGYASVKHTLGREDIKAPAGMLIFKVGAKESYMFDAAFIFVTVVDGKPASLKLLRRSRTIRSLYLFAWEEHNKRLYAEASVIRAARRQGLESDSTMEHQNGYAESSAVLLRTVGKAVPFHRNNRIWD